MEGFLGIKKTKEKILKGKENTIVEEEDERADGTKVETNQDVIDEDMFDDDICFEEPRNTKEEGPRVEGSNNGTKARPDAKNLLDTVDADMFDDDICLEELGDPACEQASSGGVQINMPHTKEPNTVTDATSVGVTKIAPVLSTTISPLPNPSCSLEKTTDYSDGVQLDIQDTKDPTDKQNCHVSAPIYNLPNASKDSPTRPAHSLTESQCMSPPEMWGDMFATGTQIGRELSQPKTPGKSLASGPSISQNLMGDLEPKSDDLFDSTKKTSNPVINVCEGVVAHDFAYFKQTLSQNIVLGERVIPKSPSSFGSVKRKRGHKFPNVMVTPSPKTTSNCPSFTDAQVSFTTDLTKYGYSTQIGENMFGDESDTDEEDCSFQAQSAPKQSTPASILKDRDLMPPPPLRKSPKIFKPPSKTTSPPESGLGIGIWGVSTQDIRAVFIDDDGSDTEDDEFGSSLPLPPLKPKAPQFSKPVASGYTKYNASLPRLGASPFIIPVAKKARLASTTQPPPQIQRLRSAPSSAMGIGHKTAFLTPSFSAPPQHISPAPIIDLHELGLSTQVLNDFAEEDVELSPVGLKKGQEFENQEVPNTTRASTVKVSGKQCVVLETETTSKSFRTSGKYAVLWDDE